MKGKGEMTARTNQVNVRLSDEETEVLRSAADEAGLTLSDWARLVMLAAAGDDKLMRQLRRVTPKVK